MKPAQRCLATTIAFFGVGICIRLLLLLWLEPATNGNLVAALLYFAVPPGTTYSDFSEQIVATQVGNNYAPHDHAFPFPIQQALWKLLLAMCTLFKLNYNSPDNRKLFFFLLGIILDLIIAKLLQNIAQLQISAQIPNPDKPHSPKDTQPQSSETASWAGTIYFLGPSILASALGALPQIPFIFLLLAIKYLFSPVTSFLSRTAALISFSLALYCGPAWIIFLTFPFANYKRQKSLTLSKFLVNAVTHASSTLMILLGIALIHQARFPNYSHLLALALHKFSQRPRTPNLGVMWYPYMQWHHDHLIFGALIHKLIPILLSFPIQQLFQMSPFNALITMTWVTALIDGEYNASDLGFLFSLLAASNFIVTSHFAVLTVAALSCIPPCITSTYLWLSRDVGNPNFVYNIALIHFLVMAYLTALICQSKKNLLSNA